MNIRNIIGCTAIVFFVASQQSAAQPFLLKNATLEHLPPNASVEQLTAHSKYVLGQYRKTRSTQTINNAKTTALSLRVIAAATRMGNLPPGDALTDSVHISYSAGRGNTVEDFKNNLNRSDLLIELSRNEGSGMMELSTQTSQVFDAHHNKLHSLLQDWDASRYTWKNDTQYLYRYNSLNQMITDSVQMWYGSIWENGPIIRKFYGVSGNMITDSTYDGFSGILLYVNNYSYSAAKELIEKVHFFRSALGWQKSSTLYHYLYDGAGNLTEYLIQGMDALSGIKYNTMRYSYRYSTTNVLVEEHIEDWEDGAWVSIKKEFSKVDAADNVIEKNHLYWNRLVKQFDTSYKEIFEYNTHGLIEKEMYYSWISPSSWANPDITNYYYEEYEATGIKGMPMSSFLKVYPIPAQNMVYIEIDVPEQQKVNLSVTDMQGRVIVQQNGATASGYYTTGLSVSGVPPGVYFLQAKGDKGLYTIQKISIIQ